MRRSTVLLATMIVCFVVAIGCSGGSSNPLVPQDSPDLTIQTERSASNTHLWGYYTVYLDIENETVDCVPHRWGMGVEPSPFNVCNFLNSNPATLGFDIHETIVEADYIDVNLDVSIMHPFPGMSQYNGYDVRGVFIGNGSGHMNYDSSLRFPVEGEDQTVGVPPEPCADGYTRWFNPSEFTMPGVLGYTPGIFATSGYQGTSNLNPYMYFADGLSVNGDLWDFITTTGDFGVFSSGQSNRRNYTIRFPNSAGVTFNYAVVASWEAEDVHPSNCQEATPVTVTITENVFYENDTSWGGDLILDIGVFNWSSVVSGTTYEYGITIDSDIIGGTHELTPLEMTDIGPGGPIPFYHVEIPVTDLNGTEGNEFWLIVEYPELDYTNDYGVPNGCGSDPLAAFFRYPLFVSDTSYCDNLVPLLDNLNGETQYMAFNEAHTGWALQGSNFEDGDIEIDVVQGVSVAASATNINFVDINNVTFDLDLSSVAPGEYDILFTNGCGLQEMAIGDSMLWVLNKIEVVGTPNIDIEEGWICSYGFS